MSTSLRVSSLTLPSADLGAENPLPDIGRTQDIHSQAPLGPGIPDEERPYFSYGKVKSILPYRMQDGYNRKRSLQEMPTIVLENDYLTATFTPQYGGKLWSLYDRQAGRDLIHANPVFQPANLALRNAWTSGGVEWNIGTTGHTPLTLAPLHTEILELADGTPVLRMYEWERLRQVCYQMDFWLPADSAHLYARIRIHNPRAEEVPMYWWSNIAVDEYEHSRVIAPATQAYAFSYSAKGIDLESIPIKHGKDLSYPVNGPASMDWFYDLPPEQRPWEAVVHGDGHGLLQCSTKRLRGRKLFMWGTGSGGKRWQTFLADEDSAYLEVQAGLAKTQMQHLPMPGGATWEWLETYGPVNVAPEQAHGSWSDACAVVQAYAEQELPQDLLEQRLLDVEEELAVTGKCASTIGWALPGSGWGALEKKRRAHANEPELPATTVFPESTLGEEQAPWLQLLEEGVFPEGDPQAEPWQYMIQSDWQVMLTEAIQSGASDHWQAWLHQGLMMLVTGDVAGALDAFERSDALQPNAWAKRNLAVLYQQHEGAETSTGLVEAFTLSPSLPLAKETCAALLQDGRYAEVIEVVEQLPVEAEAAGRLLTQYVKALLELDRLDDVERLLLDPELEIADLREGEVMLSDLWVQLQSKRDPEGLESKPIPAHLDFRMKT